ncbi:MAG: SUMF1/EgtB/PvdO family nonheme iron enzyme [Chitinivibrionales bacterium]|nr:SUMF1/EgtB/PvdO family nonheme iron enzyme [Chitinivibrionales bacterium]MBD3394361.1 SUMF1/EgtB/PvdO family nonheme iron enzyme [Chitinivibrionales bacterium]
MQLRQGFPDAWRVYQTCGGRVDAGRVVCMLLCTVVPCVSQMAAIPGGCFSMGGAGGDQDERPAHEVVLRPFQIDSCEVTWAQYDSCVKRGACTPPHYDDGRCLMWTSHGVVRVRVPHKYRAPDSPVVCVTWFQARQYCRHKGKRLPTEAEWEYAALAGGGGPYAWGSAPPGGSRCTMPSSRKPLKSGSFAPNAWGLFDMTGNVWEWTADRYERDYYRHSERDNPPGPSVGRYRTIRGGGWYSGRDQLRVRNRQWFVPEYGEVSLGVRCAK